MEDTRKPHFSARTSPDMRLLALEMRGQLNAAQLENLIHQLAEIRAKMEPEVPRSIAEAIEFDGPAATESLGSAIGGLTSDGSLKLWFRSSGFGILRVTFSPQQVWALRELLVQKAADRGTPQ